MLRSNRATRARPRLPRAVHPAALERAYAAILRALVVELGQLTQAILLPALVDAHAEREALVRGMRADTWGETLERAITTMRLAIGLGVEAATRDAIEIGYRVGEFNGEYWRRAAKAAVGVNVFRSEPWLTPLTESWARSNAALISSIPEKYLATVAVQAQAGIAGGRAPTAIAAELRDTYDLTTARARLIARTEVAKLNGQITQARQRNLGVSTYLWRSSADERVRASHAALEGKLCRWDDPSVYQDPGGEVWRKRTSIGGFEGHPGEDFQCRCNAEPQLDELIDRLLR